MERNIGFWRIWMFKLLVFLALVYIGYRWYNKLRGIIKMRSRLPNKEPASHFDLSHIEEADFRDVREDEQNKP